MLYSKANIANINMAHNRERVDEQRKKLQYQALDIKNMESKPALSIDSSNVTTPVGVGKVPMIGDKLEPGSQKVTCK